MILKNCFQTEEYQQARVQRTTPNIFVLKPQMVAFKAEELSMTSIVTNSVIIFFLHRAMSCLNTKLNLKMDYNQILKVATQRILRVRLLTFWERITSCSMLVLITTRYSLSF